jgi:pimeloyl-ACP methyl ester carboxylesterase
MGESFCTVGDVEICYETFGDPGDPALLLIMGLGTQMLAWHEDFCRELAGRGFFVIRYDNRDVGRSTHFRDVKPPSLPELLTRRFKRLAYTLDDMAADAIKLLDHLGIRQAHVTGASMGGMIAQVLAGQHPDRVLSLTSIMSTTGNRRVGQPAFKIYPMFLGRPPKGRDAYVKRGVKMFKLIGSPGFDFDEEGIREIAARSYDRDPTSSGTQRQLAAILAAGDRTADVRRIQAPTVVIHGTADPLIKSSGGKATAKAIPDSRLLLIEGMGHDLPRGTWPRIVEAIADNATRAGAQREAA